MKPEPASDPDAGKSKRKKTFVLAEDKFDHSYLKGKTYDEYPYKRSVHPFLCRLKESAEFTVTSPLSLIGAGFASLGMGLFTLFRPTPLLLFSFLYQTKSFVYVSKTAAIILLFAWQGIILFVLLFLGIFLTMSRRIQKRWVLLLHPWGLLLLYFDVFIWILMTFSLHLELGQSKGVDRWFSNHLHHPNVYFAVIYTESVCFGLLHWIYATYFIAAELTVIDRFF